MHSTLFFEATVFSAARECLCAASFFVPAGAAPSSHAPQQLSIGPWRSSLMSSDCSSKFPRCQFDRPYATGPDRAGAQSMAAMRMISGCSISGSGAVRCPILLTFENCRRCIDNCGS